MMMPTIEYNCTLIFFFYRSQEKKGRGSCSYYFWFFSHTKISYSTTFRTVSDYIKHHEQKLKVISIYVRKRYTLGVHYLPKISDVFIFGHRKRPKISDTFFAISDNFGRFLAKICMNFKEFNIF